MLDPRHGEETNQTVPKFSLCCGSLFIGGHEAPGNKMKVGLRVFYACGASLSVWKSDIVSGSYLLLSKNCDKVPT